MAHRKLDQAQAARESLPKPRHTRINPTQIIAQVEASDTQTVRESSLSRWTVSLRVSNQSALRATAISKDPALPPGPTSTPHQIIPRLLTVPTSGRDPSQAMAKTSKVPSLSMILKVTIRSITATPKHSSTNLRRTDPRLQSRAPLRLASNTFHKASRDFHQRKRTTLLAGTRISKMNGPSLLSWRDMARLEGN